MAITSLNPLGTGQQSLPAVTNANTESADGIVSIPEQSATGTGQNVPSTQDASGGTSGAATPALSPNVISLLLQSQESESMAADLFDSSDSTSTLSPFGTSTDPLFAALSDMSSEPLDSNPQSLNTLLTQMQSSASTSNSLQSQNQSLLDYLDGGENSSAGNPEAQAILDALGDGSAAQNQSTDTNGSANVQGILDLLADGSSSNPFGSALGNMAPEGLSGTPASDSSASQNATQPSQI
jgi:hypothetical protein